MSKATFPLYGGLMVLCTMLFATPADAAKLQRMERFFSLASVRQEGKPLALPERGTFALGGYRNKAGGKPISLATARSLAAPSQKELQEHHKETELASLAPLPPEIRREAMVDESGKAYAWPLKMTDGQRITSKFGPRKDPFTGKKAFHAGVDIAAPVGTPVLAGADGKVETVAVHGRLGKYVKVKHDEETYTLYGHLSKTKVREGQYVYGGQVIGAVGSTGRSTGPHLDFSVRKNGKPVNPLPDLAIPEDLSPTVATARR